jgi:xanthine dioxygenase
MAIKLFPLLLPASADPTKFYDFGRQVTGVNPGCLTPEQFTVIQDALYKVRSAGYELYTTQESFFSQHDILLFRDVTLTPEQQYALTKVRHSV